MNYLPELRCALVDAAQRHYQSTEVLAHPAACRPSRVRRVPGGRPLALVGVLVLGSASGAVAAGGGRRVPAPVPPRIPAVALAAPHSTPAMPGPVPARSVTPRAPHSTPAMPGPVSARSVTPRAPHSTPAMPEPVSARSVTPRAPHSTPAMPAPAPARSVTPRAPHTTGHGGTRAGTQRRRHGRGVTRDQHRGAGGRGASPSAAGRAWPTTDGRPEADPLSVAACSWST